MSKIHVWFMISHISRVVFGCLLLFFVGWNFFSGARHAHLPVLWKVEWEKRTSCSYNRTGSRCPVGSTVQSLKLSLLLFPWMFKASHCSAKTKAILGRGLAECPSWTNVGMWPTLEKRGNVWASSTVVIWAIAEGPEELRYRQSLYAKQNGTADSATGIRNANGTNQIGMLGQPKRRSCAWTRNSDTGDPHGLATAIEALCSAILAALASFCVESMFPAFSSAQRVSGSF